MYACVHMCVYVYILFHNKNKELKNNCYSGPSDGSLVQAGGD